MEIAQQLQVKRSERCKFELTPTTLHIQIKTLHDDLGNPITNTVISNNSFFSKATDQTTFYFKSDVNDFASMGSFSGNYYARPFDENLTIPNMFFVILRKSGRVTP